jgi:predicted acylesterase/phospholipase RssA
VGLLETGMLPHIVSGTSAGSAIGAILCTRTDDELRRDLKPEILAEKLRCFRAPWSQRIKCFLRTGNLFDFDEWLELIKW